MGEPPFGPTWRAVHAKHWGDVEPLGDDEMAALEVEMCAAVGTYDWEHDFPEYGHAFVARVVKAWRKAKGPT